MERRTAMRAAICCERAQPSPRLTRGAADADRIATVSFSGELPDHQAAVLADIERRRRCDHLLRGLCAQAQARGPGCEHPSSSMSY